MKGRQQQDFILRKLRIAGLGEEWLREEAIGEGSQRWEARSKTIYRLQSSP